MNKLQQAYTVAKAAFDAIEAEGNHEDEATWEAALDRLLEAEAEMVEWALDHADGKIPAKQIAVLRDRWMFPQWHDRMVNLAFRLAI